MAAPALAYPAATEQERATAGTSFEPVGVSDEPSPEDRDRLTRMDRAYLAYTGRLPKPFKIKPGQADPNACSNRCEPIVTKGASFLFGKDLTITIDQEDEETTAPTEGSVDTGEDSAQDFLEDLWEANQQMTKLNKLAVNGGIFGHTFCKYLPNPHDAKQPGRLIVLDPRQVRMECDPDDGETVLAFVVQHTITLRDRKRTRLERRQVIERIYDADGGESPLDATAWRITDQERKASQQPGQSQQQQMAAGVTGGWQTVAQTDWPYPWPPIFHAQNLPEPNEAWGSPDITDDLIDANDNLNRAQSNINKIIMYHAGPLTYATNMGNVGTIERDPSAIITLPSEHSELHNLEMQSDLSSSLNFLAVLRTNMDEQSRVPAVALGRIVDLPRGQMSGIALELLFQPLIEKTEQKRRLYGEMIENICSCVLEYAGFKDDDGDQMCVTIGWPQILPHDPMVDWQVAAEKNAMGVSKYTILSENGYKPEDELQRTAQEKQDAMVSAAQMFGKGKGLPSFPPTVRGSVVPMLPPPGGNNGNQQDNSGGQ